MYPKYRGEVLWPEFFLLCGLFPAAVALWYFAGKLLAGRVVSIDWPAILSDYYHGNGCSMRIDMEDLVICFPHSLPSSCLFMCPSILLFLLLFFLLYLCINLSSYTIQQKQKCVVKVLETDWISKDLSVSFRSPNSQSSVICLGRYKEK